MYDHIKAEDSEVYSAIMQEIGRQRNKIELIASENMVSESSCLPHPPYFSPQL